MAAPKVGQLPDDQLKAIVEADLANRGTQNATTPAEQRVRNLDIPLSEGPVKGSRDEFLPATYKTGRAGNIRTDR